jgi:hypothetical protein
LRLQTFAVSALKKDESVETALKASWKNKAYGITAGFNAAGLVRKPLPLGVCVLARC